MPRLRVLSGSDVVGILTRFGFAEGSHVKLRRVKDGLNQIVIVPSHREVDRGALQAIYRQALRFIAESELKPYFYSA